MTTDKSVFDQPEATVVSTDAPTGLEQWTKNRGFFGHPSGLATLFFTEMWERFSYYGLRPLLVLFMSATIVNGGYGFDRTTASAIVGIYAAFVYLMSLPGGWVADHLLGARSAVFIGGIIIACGHFSMVFHSTSFVFLGMALIAIGTGLLKPNISVMVGNLYRDNDARRDSGFSIFYMGINVGALLAPLVVGFLAKTQTFRNMLSSAGLDPNKCWHWGFAAAGVGMLVGLFVYVRNRERLAHVGNRVPRAVKVKTDVAPAPPLTRGDWLRIIAIVILFIFTILFWAVYEQKGSSLNLFANELTRNEIFGIGFSPVYLQSLTPAFVIILTPLFATLWLRMGDRQPSSPVKFTLGLLFIGLAYALLVPATLLLARGQITFWWLVGLYFLEVCGEMCLSPVGLSTVTKLAPAKLVGLMMGAWFLATSIGNKLAGYLAGFFVSNNPWQLTKLYGGIAAGLLLAAVILTILTPTIKRLMGRTT